MYQRYSRWRPTTYVWFLNEITINIEFINYSLNLPKTFTTKIYIEPKKSSCPDNFFLSMFKDKNPRVIITNFKTCPRWLMANIDGLNETHMSCFTICVVLVFKKASQGPIFPTSARGNVYMLKCIVPISCQVSKLVCGWKRARNATWTRSRVMMMMKQPWHMIQDCTSSHRHEHSHARYDAGAAKSQGSAQWGLVLTWVVWANLECRSEFNDVLEVGIQLADSPLWRHLL